MEICEKIKFLRMRQGMTLEELGLKVGVGKSTVRKWETGQIANMRRDKIASLADALNVSRSYLMGWEDEINVDMDMKNNSGNTSDNIGNIDKLLYCERGFVMKIGERIKNRRVELNITQDELARRLGYSDKSSISRIENSSKLTLNKMQLLADALNVSPSYLMGWEDEINVDIDMRNNSGTISNSIGSDSSESNNTYTTNNHYSSPCSQREKSSNKDTKATITSKELFYEMLMVLKDMDDEQLNDMIRYGEFIKAR